MQVRGGKEVTLVPGQTFYEGPNDVHTVGRNASTTEPAKFIVILLKKIGSRRGVARRVVRLSSASGNEDDGYLIVEVAVSRRALFSSIRARHPLISAYLLDEGATEVAIEEMLGTVVDPMADRLVE